MQKSIVNYYDTMSQWLDKNVYFCCLSYFLKLKVNESMIGNIAILENNNYFSQHYRIINSYIMYLSIRWFYSWQFVFAN